MKTDSHAVLLDFRTRFEQTGGDLRIDAYLRERGLRDDETLADIIEADARLRRQRGETVRLEDYLSAVPDLATRTIPLDAAVEATLRSAIDGGSTTIEAVERLSESHPALRTLIQEAAVLGRLLPTTTRAPEGDAGPTLQPGDEIGEPMEDGRRRYLVRERLGAGVQGEVHLAVDRRLTGEAGEALVAIKALRRADDDEARRRFIEEAARARRIDHPNVVRVIDRSVHEGREYIVFDYIDGGTLEAYVRERDGRLPLREAARILAGVARGVHAAHARGLVHGDLKPGNILLTGDRSPKVADFGVAALLRQDADGGATEGLQGNLAFMAPEQFRLDPRWRSPLVDVYALGGLLYWMTTGRYPRGQSIGEILASHRTDETPAKEGDIDDVDLDLIIRRALAHDPGDRQPAAGALADDLEAWLERRPIPWTKPPLTHVTRLWLRRRPWSAAGVIALLLAAIGAAGAAVQFRIQAQAAARDADATRTELAERAAERERFDEMVTDMLVGIELKNRMRLTSVDLYDLWVGDLTIRKLFPDMQSVRDAHAAGRRETLDAHLRQAEQDNGHIRAQVIRIALGSFMLEDGDYADAVQTLAAAESALAAIAPPDDATLEVARSLRAAAEVHAGVEMDAGRLFEVEREIANALPRYGDDAPVRAAMLDALRRLYGPDLLDRPDRLAALSDGVESGTD